jgi:tol-pal system protein YbgF
MPSARAAAFCLGLALAAGGCATQSGLVDMEAEVAALKARVARIDGGAGGPFPAARAAPAGGDEAGPATGTEALDLTISVDQMRQDLADLRGQMDEQNYRLSSFISQSDSRLAALEDKAGIAPVPTPGATAPRGASGPPPNVAVGTSPAPAVRPGPDGGVVLPGVVIAPRDEDQGAGVSAETAFQLASGDFKRGHYNLAAAGFANFLEQYPDSKLVPDATYWLGESYRSQGMDARAAQVWEMQSESFPKAGTTPKALLALGETYRAMDNIPAAEKALKRLIASFPVSDEAQRAKLILAELR